MNNTESSMLTFDKTLLILLAFFIKFLAKLLTSQRKDFCKSNDLNVYSMVSLDYSSD